MFGILHSALLLNPTIHSLQHIGVMLSMDRPSAKPAEQDTTLPEDVNGIAVRHYHRNYLRILDYAIRELGHMMPVSEFIQHRKLVEQYVWYIDKHFEYECFVYYELNQKQEVDPEECRLRIEAEIHCFIAKYVKILKLASSQLK